MRARFYHYLSFQLMLVALLPTILIGSAMIVPMISERREQLLDQERLRALQAGRTMDAIYAERLGFATLLIELLSNRPVLVETIQEGNLEGIAAFVQQTRTDTLFDLVSVIDQHNRLLAQDGKTELWSANQAVMASPQFWSVSGEGLAVQVARPILLSGRQLGTIIGTFVIDNAFLTDMRARTDLDQSILFGNQLVASSLAGRAAPATIGLPDANVEAQVLAGGTPTVVEAQINNEPYLTHYAPLRSPNGPIIGMIEILIPLASVHAVQLQATWSLLLITILVACMGIALGWVLARWFTRPIGVLMHAAESIGRGDLYHQVVAGGPTEVRVLGQAIDQMRKQLAQSHSALDAEKSRYENILESVEEAVITLDPHARVTSLNRSAEALLDCTRATAHGQMLHQVVHVYGDTPLAIDLIPPLGTTRLAICASHDRIVTVEATRSSVLALPDTTPSEHILVLRDVSEGAAVAQLKEAFLANITHEFQTPLAALIVSLEILRDDHGANTLSSTDREAMLTTIHIGVQRLNTLVRNLLDSASLQAGYFRVAPDVSQLLPLINEALETMEPLLQQQQQTVELILPDTIPAVVADERRIVQVLVNLLSNASKFGPTGDTLQLTVQVADNEVVVGVTDHGPGIAPNRRQYLFERFLRPGSDIVRAQGVGLGLAIVKAIIERHGGQVRVQGGDQNATSFLFTLRRTVVSR